MKKFLFLIVFLFYMNYGLSQGISIAYTNLDSIVLAIPETKSKLKVMETYSKQLSSQLETKQKELEQKFQDYQRNRDNWIPEIIQEKEKEMQQLEQALVEFQQTAQQRVQEKQTKEFDPLYKQAREMIKIVANELGYQYVISQDPRSGYPLVYADPQYDITQKVIEKLNNK